ncbi:MAG: hypothetical protein JNM68_01270, partial [Dinghuibacter sp.]|nr:hypothetical protein [Dinghuibacter sp.]
MYKLDKQVTDNKSAAGKLKAPAAVSMPDNRPQTTVQQKRLLGMNRMPEAAATVQRKVNNTGLPDQLKTGVEHLSGISMNDVRVHYNSP